MKKGKIRATKKDINPAIKYKLIKSVVSRFNYAIENEFYLEGVTLIESLICDRMESRIGELSKTNTFLGTIGSAFKQLRKIENDNILIELTDKIFIWSRDRNIAIHEAVKIELNKVNDFENFLKFSKKTALEGRKLFNSYNKRLNTLRKK